jgi:Mg2+-importing ATPase
VFHCDDVATASAATASARLFQSAWFVESLLTQTLVIHVIRTNKVPFLESRASTFLARTSLAIMGVGIALPFTTLGAQLGFGALPLAFWPYLLAMLLAYLGLTQAVKRWLLRRGWI